MRCGNCNNATTDELLLSYPSQVICTIDNKFHYMDNTCDYEYLVEEYQHVVKECEICGNEYHELNRTICPECGERLKRLLYDED